METYSLAIQRRLGIDRTKKCDFKFYGGCQWVSITDKFAKYVIKNYKKYAKYYRFSQISDESLFQTIVMDSEYSKNLYIEGLDDNYNACMRMIDWKRGNPYIFRQSDIEEIFNSECVFARKFDERIDKKIIDMIVKNVLSL